MKFCMVGGLQGAVLGFEFHQNRSSGFGAIGVEICPFSLIWPFTYTKSLYKIVISQQIEEVIANGHEKLNNLMIAQIP